MRPVTALGDAALAGLRQVGGLGLVVVRAARALPRLDRRELTRSTAHFGFDSIPLVLAVAVFTGGIISVVANINVARYGAQPILGWAAGYTVLREFGPLLTAIALAGRIGARNAAELGSMVIGGQLEGLRGVGVDPFALLVAPRVAASAIAIAALGVLANLAAIFAAALFGMYVIRCDFGLFFRSFETMLGWRDLAAGVIKTIAFGVLISLVSTRCGLLARGGAQAVGRVAALSVVANAALLSAFDWVLTVVLERVL